MKTYTLLLMIVFLTTAAIAQQQRMTITNIRSTNVLTNNLNVSQSTNYFGNIQVYNNVSNEDFQVDNNIPYQVRNELNNPNIEVQQIIVQQVYEQSQIQERQTPESRGTNPSQINEMDAQIVEQTRRTERVREDKERALNLNLSEIQLPSPAPLFEDKEISLAKTKSVKLGVEKQDNKTNHSKLHLEKGFYKKHIRNPLRSWFKRTFSKQKSFKAKLTCCFK